MSYESEATIGMGGKVEIGNGASPESFVEIHEPKDFDGPEISQQFADVTHMQSPLGFPEQRATQKSNSTVTFKINDLPTNAGQILLVAAANTNPATRKNFRVTFSSGRICNFAAYPGLKFASPMKNANEIAVTLSLTGAPTFS
jgi:hypothetical protein